MQINKETVATELDRFIEKLLALPEVVYAQVRDIIICKEEERADKLQEIMDKSYHDCYSDIDLSILVKRNPKEIVTPLEYLKGIERFGITAEKCLGVAFVEESNMCRIILKNGMRYDFGVSFEEDDKAEFIHILQREEEYSNPNWPLVNINRFWFIQIQALGKLYRKDFLIGDHLANINLNETLVMQMVLRDLQYGTNHHRYGYEEELAYLKYRGKWPIHTENERFQMIADKIYCAALACDELAGKFYPNHKNRSSEFFEIWKCYEKGRIG